MYGLEKKPGDKAAFELEKEIKEKPDRAKEIIDDVEQKIHEIKDLLRKGANEKDFDNLGVLLQGYMSLPKVLKKVAK